MSGLRRHDTTNGVRLPDRRPVVRTTGGATFGCLLIVLLIGAAEYPLKEVDAARLERSIRRRCVGERQRALDDDARACLQLADVLAEDLATGTSPEPIELRTSHIDGLCEHVLDEDLAELADLRAALERYCRRRSSPESATSS
jgi:hypothetical protein